MSFLGKLVPLRIGGYVYALAKTINAVAFTAALNDIGKNTEYMNLKIYKQLPTFQIQKILYNNLSSVS